MATKKRTSLEILSDNLRAAMALPDNKHISTAPKLALVSKVSQKTINNIERRRHYPKLDSVERLAKALKLDTYLLLAPAEDSAFAAVCLAYSVSDDRGREFLLDTAETLLKKRAGRSKDEKAGAG